MIGEKKTLKNKRLIVTVKRQPSNSNTGVEGALNLSFVFDR